MWLKTAQIYHRLSRWYLWLKPVMVTTSPWGGFLLLKWSFGCILSDKGGCSDHDMPPPVPTANTTLTTNTCQLQWEQHRYHDDSSPRQPCHHTTVWMEFHRAAIHRRWGVLLGCTAVFQCSNSAANNLSCTMSAPHLCNINYNYTHVSMMQT